MTIEELAVKHKTTTRVVELALAAPRVVGSLDAPASFEDGQASVSETFEDMNADDPAELAEMRAEWVGGLLDVLPADEREIVSLLFGLDAEIGELTIPEAADRVGLPRKECQAIRDRALRRLQDAAGLAEAAA
jgi:DNA-directed RNA polymerase sigma subunit (sigma70/sigma32)